MIISDKHSFVFIHIPKCAGTSVRKSILPFHDGGEWALKTLETHPEYGELDYRHLPLNLLAKINADVFQKVKSYDSYAIVRDPFARFRSAISQRAKMYLDTELPRLSEDELLGHIQSVMDYLNGNPSVIPSEYTHFIRQSDYIFLDDEQIVNNLFPLEHIDQLFKAVREKFGVEQLDVAHANQTQVFVHPSLKHFAYRGSDLARSILPADWYNNLRKSMRGMLMTPKKGIEASAFDAPQVRSFIETYYAKDIALHRESLQAFETKRAGAVG
ncbi:sulfotransferase family protein (plasmid) [Aliiroseovarius sp. M344]|uniref:sulfotransferase family protein n=1 Tax=Aliiroseovarius sp. M344 TaxID=2867010 RepID=UPI0021ADE9D0|nr:sulfotransferase family protein [Aliiroseovarius sp. M344]UWQ16054.1 sulfotransferase family protein [Aliiroseovarius sp. M344]